MKILSLVLLYNQFSIFYVPINHNHIPRSSQKHFIIYVVICVSSTQRLWVESEQWSRDRCYVSMNDTSLILIQTGYIGLMSLRPNGHQPLGRGIQLAQYCDQKLSWYAISRRLPPLCSLALRLRNTKVPVWTHVSIGYPKMDISHWDAAIHYCIQLAQLCDQTRSFNAISRRSPPMYSLALRLRNTKVPVWTHGSIRYPKMYISHWDAAIHYGVQLAQYCDQTLSCNAISPRSPPLCSFALRLRNTKVPVWTHGSIGYPKMDISHWDAAIHYGITVAQYCDQNPIF